MDALTTSVLRKLTSINLKLGRLVAQTTDHPIRREYEVTQALLQNTGELLRLVGADAEDDRDISALDTGLDKLLDGTWKTRDFIREVEKVTGGILASP